MSTARRLERPGFGHEGGSNLADYLSATEHADQIEMEMEPGERLVEIPVDRIDRSPFQARVTFDEEEIAALGEDIQEHGLNHPVTVREGSGGRYELVAGERRWLAAKRVGLPHILARLRPLDDFAAHLVGVSENNRRANLSPWEMSREAARLLEHAKEASRPHTQRDLARYLNRNVSLVNQQLAIAAAITEDLLVSAEVKEENVCRLPHRVLHRIAKLPEEQRRHALQEALLMQQPRISPGNGAVGLPKEPGSGENKIPEVDQWSKLWEIGGFQVQVRHPLRSLDPDEARKYLQIIAPAFGGLAVRASACEGGTRVLRWNNPLGRLIFVLAPESLSEVERAKVLSELLATNAP